MTAFWNVAVGKLVERWLVTSFAAAVYWLALAALWALGSDSPRDEAARRLREFGALSTGEQVALLVIGMVVLAGSSLLVTYLTLPVLRLIEGYWPRWAEPLSRRLRERHVRRATRYAGEANPLLLRHLGYPAAQGGGPPLNRSDVVRLVQLEERLRWLPRADRMLPTHRRLLRRRASLHRR